jgi:hypothetical protein
MACLLVICVILCNSLSIGSYLLNGSETSSKAANAYFAALVLSSALTGQLLCR